MKKNLEKAKAGEEEEESTEPVKKKVKPDVSKEVKSDDATNKGGSIMKKALNKAISKGGEVPKSEPEKPIDNQPKDKKASPKKTASKGIENMKKQL
jgi:hypothetical protein